MSSSGKLCALVLLGLGALVACSSSSDGGDDGAGGSTGSGADGNDGSSPSGASGGATGSDGTSDASSGGSSGGSGSSGGAGSGSGGGGGTSGSDSGTSEGGTVKSDGGGSSSCLGASLLADLGKTRMIVGGAVADATAASTPIDVRYTYLSGGLFDSSVACTSCTSCSSGGTSCANENGATGCAWWGCWQYDKDPPGETARNLVAEGQKASPAYIPMFTYYEILNSTGNSQGADEVAGANKVSVMQRYLADWRFLLQQIGQSVAILQIEPDFWGFANQVNANPHALPAAVASANATDCSGVENSIAGMGQCMVSMVRKYAPHARVGLNASAWGGGMDVTYNSSASLDVVGYARTLATFMAACGADKSDFVTIETSDRDAGYYASIGQDRSWDPTNKTLPDFTQDLTWAKALTEDLDVPALYWQTPLGNASQNNTSDHWVDNRVDYFFAHMADLAAAHIIGVAYGAGASGQTTPESDGGNFIAKVKAYQAAGGQSFCP